MRPIHKRSHRLLTPLAFHRRLDGYQRSPLVPIPPLAADLGALELVAKVETERFGLPSFKVLGASWAIYRALCSRLGNEPCWDAIADLRDAVRRLRPITLVAATEGNHGRAVAHMARLLGLDARIVVPSSISAVKVAAIASEGARIDTVDGTYDDAVARAAELSGDDTLVVSDTAWEGYEEIPQWVIEGYSTIFAEVAEERGSEFPDVIAVQMGVGSLAAAAVDALRPRTTIVVAEPRVAACGKASAEAGRIVEVPGPHLSTMAGLNCGRPSTVAWPRLRDGVDAYVTLEDEDVLRAVADLATMGIPTGPAGAAGLAALGHVRELIEGRRVLILCTEGR